MSEVKHTPGKWLTVYDKFEGLYHVKLKESSRFGGTVFIAKNIEQGKDGGKADAELIASAPQLLADNTALRARIAELEKEREKN